MENIKISSFFSFWIKNFRVSFLLIFMLILSGLFSLYTIPKESTPDIKFGIISIGMSYPGVSPQDIDNLITEKIEKEIQDLDGIKKITSTSSVGFSSVVVELENDVNTRDILTDIKDKIDKINFPEDANDAIVQEISTKNELMFQALLYGDEAKFDFFKLNSLAKVIQHNFEGKYGIVSVDVGGGISDGVVGAGGGNDQDYEIKVLISASKIEVLGLTINDVINRVRAYNRNTPIGNYTIGDLNYDFRIDGEFTAIGELEDVIIRDDGYSKILLKDIAVFQKEYRSDSIRKLGLHNESGYNYISLNFNKKAGSNIFAVSKTAKEELEKFLQNTPEFSGLKVVYVRDLSEVIKDDYKQLASNGVQTLVFVFIIVFLFFGIRESIVASILITIAFALTFMGLDGLGRSLNFLTNFSLVLSFGIAVDTVTVIIEGAVEKQKLGYNKATAVLLAIKELKASLISGTFATLCAFLPMIFLPGIVGKFLSYIPLTTFFMLGAALFISLTLAGALFWRFTKDYTFYFKNDFVEELLDADEKELLEKERKGKKVSLPEKESKRMKFLSILNDWYFAVLKKFMLTRKGRVTAVFGPIVLLILTFIFLSGRIGFTLFPQSDEGQINIGIEAKTGTDKEALIQYLPAVDAAIKKHPELRVYFTQIQGNSMDIFLELKNKTERELAGQKSVFDIEKEVTQDLQKLESQGLKVSVKSQGGGPPITKPIGVKLIASDNRKIDTLRNVAADFEKYLLNTPGARNVGLSSSDNPGQFVFRFDTDKLSFIGLTPLDLTGEIYSYVSGTKVGTIKSELEDNDILIKLAEFDETLNPDDITNLQINTREGKIRIGDYMTYTFEKSLSSIGRENGNITITVDADTEADVVATDIQPKLMEFASTYNFPEGISYGAGGENQENSDLIIGAVQSFVIALFLIFGILVLQFNSYSQPMMILYSALASLAGVNIGLFIMGYPYSMPFAIGFISLIGILVNNSVILIETINSNVSKVRGSESKTLEKNYLEAILSAGKTRFQPVVITLIINLVGVIPLALQDPFWGGLGFTIVFGLIAGTFLTLVSIPALYYMSYKRRYTHH